MRKHPIRAALEGCIAILEYSDLFHTHHKNRIGWSNNPIRSRGKWEKARCLDAVFLITASNRVIDIDEVVLE